GGQEHRWVRVSSSMKAGGGTGGAGVFIDEGGLGTAGRAISVLGDDVAPARRSVEGAGRGGEEPEGVDERFGLVGIRGGDVGGLHRGLEAEDGGGELHGGGLPLRAALRGGVR